MNLDIEIILGDEADENLEKPKYGSNERDERVSEFAFISPVRYSIR